MAWAVMVAAVLLTAAPAALAHEGHGDPALDDSVLHYLKEPVHLPLTVSLLVVLAIVWRWAPNKLLHRAARARR